MVELVSWTQSGECIEEFEMQRCKELNEMFWMFFRQHEMPSKFHELYSITCQFDFRGSKNVLIPKCNSVEYNQSFFETFKYNTVQSNLGAYFAL